MNTIKKITLVISAIALGIIPTFADESTPSFESSAGGDIVSSYIWRGQYCGGVSLQPTLSINWNGISLAGWGSIGIDQTDTKEFDLTLGYSAKGFSISITDYYFNYWGGGCPYFEYAKGSTTHVLEGQIGYDFEFMSINWYTNFAGADGTKTSGDMAYSSYLSIASPFELGGLNWEAEIGIVPWGTSLYGTNGFALTNISLKANKPIKLSDDYSLGLFTQTAWNPTSEGGYIVMGLCF